MGLTNQNNELKFRLQAMEQQARLRDGTHFSLKLDQILRSVVYYIINMPLASHLTHIYIYMNRYEIEEFSIFFVFEAYWDNY